MCTCWVVVRLAKTLFAAVTKVLMRFWLVDVMMYLRSQDVLHVVFILHSGGPVHFDLLFGLLLGLGFSKLYPQRHDVGMLCVSRSLYVDNILVSFLPHSPLHWVRTGSQLARLLASCARNWEQSPLCGAHWVWSAPVLIRARAPPDLERQNLSLDLSTTGWHYACPGHLGAEMSINIWKYDMTLNGVLHLKHIYTWTIG